MPIHIPIYVNERLIKTYHIGRLEGDTDPNSINTYIIVEDDQLWQAGTKFTHRYGDGLDTCVYRGLGVILDVR